MIVGRLILLLLICVISLPSMAGVFRWEDQSGQIHFGNVPPAPVEDYRFGTWSSQFIKQKAEADKKQAQAKKQSKEENTKKPFLAKDNNNTRTDKGPIAQGNQTDGSIVSEILKPDSGELMSPGEDKNKNQEISAVDIEQNELDKCGVFKTFVRDYKDMLPQGCYSKICKIYRRQLLRYKSKLKEYCK